MSQGIAIRNFTAAVLIFISSILFFIFTPVDGPVLVIWGLIVPYSVIQYTLGTQLFLPLSEPAKRSFWTFLVLIGALLVVTALPFGIFCRFYCRRMHEDAVAFTILNACFQFFVMAPLTWYFYKRSRRVKEEVVHLKQELGQSEASVDFLRSQINPHFLFNALNSIYALALNEGAQRTADGVQMLGDLMRFLMHDNEREEIDLTREAEYLQQYIRLQQLRTEGSESVLVSARIADVPPGLRIAPMLLIPFVENAFKHGISFRVPSYIKVGLEVKEGVVYLDVHNSIAPRSADDPERDRSGIGLANVRQRLALIYPGRHELFVRDTGAEYFVHLWIRLT